MSEGSQAVAARVAALLVRRGETVAVAESSAGGLIAARLLALPGASAYFRGGAVVYTIQARQALLGITPEEMAARRVRASTEPYAGWLALEARTRMDADWGLGETGAAGPTGNRYGDPAGHCCVGVSGRLATLARTVGTGSADREANMEDFAVAALRLLEEALAR